MSIELKIKRFIYLSSEDAVYLASSKTENNFKLENVPSVLELINAKKEATVLNMIESANTDPLCVKREALLFVLAVTARNAKTEENKTKAYDAVLKICKTQQEFFLFIKLMHSLHKTFAHGMKRVIHNYYAKADPLELKDIFINSGSFYGWKHRDLMRLTHLKPLTPAQEVLYAYAFKNFKEAKKKFEELKSKNDNVSTLLKDVFRQIEIVETIKHCQDEQQFVDLIKDHKFQVHHINAKLLKSTAVWEAIIPTLEIPVLLNLLHRLNRAGFLKYNSSTLNKVVDILTDNKKCQSSKVQPGLVYTYLKFFETGRPIDPQKRLYILQLDKQTEPAAEAIKKDLLKEVNAPKNHALLSALYKLLQHSFKNVHTTGRRVLVTLDVREEYMSHYCYPNKSITCLEAAGLIAYSFLKAEKDATVAFFNGTAIKVVPLDKGMNFLQYLQKLKDQKGDFVLLNSPFTWSTENKKPIDVFLNIMYLSDAPLRVPKEHKPTEKPMDCLKRYRQKMHLQRSKLVTMALGGRNLEIADGSPHVLDICGFDPMVPKVIEACCKGVLQ